ncbi:MAG: haloacid dehalogenase type II [Candidatus Nanopelagicales bacterium]
MLPPEVIVFDVNETLSDLSPLAARFAEVGLSAETARLWFASVLREGFALTAVGQPASFAGIGREVLRGLLVDAGAVPAEESVEAVMAAFLDLDVHPDVATGVRRLAAGGTRLVTLSNGAAAVAERLLDRAGLRESFEHVLSVDDAGIWKPAVGAYRYAADVCGTTPDRMLMVAVHPWDLHGAGLAGLRTAWVRRRSEEVYPSYFRTPDLAVSGVDDLAHLLAADPPPGPS